MFRQGKTREKRERSSNGGKRGPRRTCPTFGFPCSKALAARFRTLSPILQVPIYQAGEQALENMIGLIDSMTPEELQEQKRHLQEHHGVQRMIEQLEPYDLETSNMLRQEWQQRYRNENIVRQIVNEYVNKGMKPEYIRDYINLGIRYMKEYGPGKSGPTST